MENRKIDQTQEELEKRLVSVVPAPRQVEWQKLEFYAFVHFTVNTFTDKEWGDGSESPDIFHPEKLDAAQWVSAVKSAGMKGLILTCKHHDGFCLWKSGLTKHTVEYSPFGRDIVKEVSDACRDQGIKFGVYLSPWDRNCGLYGQGKAYDDFFIGQLTELLTGYGEVFSVWFDGACGEGPNGKKQIYDWERYYGTIRRLQPNACISVCGPDVRWCGNEGGYTREAEWSVVPERAKDSEIIAEKSQQEDSEEFRLRRVDARDGDLGSRELLLNEEKLIWYPAEVNTSIRPGWFWHEYENDRVKSLEELIRVYNNSVGGNATFLLNIPPTREGLFHENDVKRLGEIGEYLRKAFRENVLASAKLEVETAQEIDAAEVLMETECKSASPDDLRADDYEGSCEIPKGAVLTASWEKPVVIGNIVIKENILRSQRVERFCVEARQDGAFREVYHGTVIGYKRIIPLKALETDCIRIRITHSRRNPILAFLGVYAGGEFCLTGEEKR